MSSRPLSSLPDTWHPVDHLTYGCHFSEEGSVWQRCLTCGHQGAVMEEDKVVTVLRWWTRLFRGRISHSMWGGRKCPLNKGNFIEVWHLFPLRETCKMFLPQELPFGVQYFWLWCTGLWQRVRDRATCLRREPCVFTLPDHYLSLPLNICENKANLSPEWNMYFYCSMERITAGVYSAVGKHEKK